MLETVKTAVAVIGIDIRKNSVHVVGLNQRGTTPGGTIRAHAQQLKLISLQPSPSAVPYLASRKQSLACKSIDRNMPIARVE